MVQYQYSITVEYCPFYPTKNRVLMIAQTTDSSSVNSVDTALTDALFEAGLTSELRDALVSNPDFTLDAVQRIKDLFGEHRHAEGAEDRRDLLSIMLVECS